MKNKLIIFILGLCMALAACHPEAPEQVPADPPSDYAENPNQQPNALIVDGKTYYTGLGYSISQDRFYRPAIDDFDMIERFDMSNALEVKVDVVKTNKDLEKITKKQRASNINFVFKVFGFGRKSKKRIEEEVKIHEGAISVVVRISVQRYRYFTAGDPFLDPRAIDLIKRGKIRDFLRRHGAMYVNDHTLGGELFYVYNYDVSKYSRATRSNFERNIKANIDNIFGIDNGKVLTKEEKTMIENAKEKYVVYSNVPGFSPTMVTQEGQVQAAVQNLQNYLAAHRDKAATMQLELESYANLDLSLDLTPAEVQGFKNAYYQEAKCFSDLEKWTKYRDELGYIYNSTAFSQTKDKALSAILQILPEVDKARNCEGSTTPPDGLYAEVKQLYQSELSVAPVFRYYHYKAFNHYLTNDYNVLGGGSHGYTLQGIKFNTWTQQVPGSIPLYTYYNHDKVNHFFTTNPGELQHIPYGADYTYNGMVGFVLPEAGQGKVPLHRYSTGNALGYANHVLTTDPTEISSFPYSDRYRYDGVIGYVDPGIL